MRGAQAWRASTFRSYVMGAFTPLHWIILIAVLVLVFGGGKLSSIMGDAAKGVKAFKDGLKDEPGAEAAKEVKGEALPRTDKEKEELRS
jgi:sec-independent protein translocase protein TatA